MKHNSYLFNIRVLWRSLVVIAVAAFATLFCGLIFSQYLDSVWRSSGDSGIYSFFYFLSNNRETVVAAVCIFAFLLCSTWIMRPMFHNFSAIVRQNIHVGAESARPVQLPRALKTLENDLNHVNRELIISRYAAKDAERRKDELVVYLAHDIRTPLTSVLGYLELLDDSPELSPQDRKKFTEIALRKSRKMASLVEELFEVTRFNISQIEPQRSEVNIVVMMNQLLEELMPLLESRSITAEIINDGLRQIFVDPYQMARAFDNILHNAAYYTPPGERITVHLDFLNERHPRIRIQNTGVELPPEVLNRLFEKFYRGEEARTTETGGSGLGLSIAKNIVEAHGGTIFAENADKITTFTIVL